MKDIYTSTFKFLTLSGPGLDQQKLKSFGYYEWSGSIGQVLFVQVHRPSQRAGKVYKLMKKEQIVCS